MLGATGVFRGFRRLFSTSKHVSWHGGPNLREARRIKQTWRECRSIDVLYETVEARRFMYSISHAIDYFMEREPGTRVLRTASNRTDLVGNERQKHTQ